jgi:molecular chaperone DnaJ
MRPEPLVPEERPVDLGHVSPLRSFRSVSPSRGELFDWLWDNFSRITPPKSGRIQELTIEIPLTREQARRGGVVEVLLPVRSVCPECGGYGGIGGFECYRCAGEGAITGEMPVSLSFPPGLARDHAVVMSLAPYGIHNLHATVVFRPREADVL